MPDGPYDGKHDHHWVPCWCDLPHLRCAGCGQVREKRGETQLFGEPLP